MHAIVYVDGSHRPYENASVSAWLAVLIRQPGPLFACDSVRVVSTKENSGTAEWRALVLAARWLRAAGGLTSVCVRADYANVVNVVNGVFGPCARERPKTLTHTRQLSLSNEALRDLARLGVPVAAVHVPREANVLADRLSKGESVSGPWGQPPAVRDPAAARRATELVAAGLHAAAGRPGGRDDEFWHEAEALLRRASAVW